LHFASLGKQVSQLSQKNRAAGCFSFGRLWQCLSLMQSFSLVSANIAISHALLRTRFFGLYFCRRMMSLSSNTLTQSAPKPPNSGK